MASQINRTGLPGSSIPSSVAFRVAAAASLLLMACGQEARGPAAHTDLAVVTPADLAGSPGPADFAIPADFTAPPDLAMSPDLGNPADLATLRDLSVSPDLAGNGMNRCLGLPPCPPGLFCCPRNGMCLNAPCP